MAIVVNSVGKNFKIEIKHEEEKIGFIFKQLSYKVKSEITGMVTVIQQGQVTIDATMQVFYNIKYGLKKVEGLVNEEGNEYKLKFDDKQKRTLTDECVDELLATALSDNLQFTARELSQSVIPKEIKHPLTGAKLEGVEVIPAAASGGTEKK